MRDYQDPLGQLQMMRKLNQQVFEAQRPNSAKNQPSNNASTVNTSGRHSARERPVLNYGERLYRCFSRSSFWVFDSLMWRSSSSFRLTPFW